MRINVFSYMDNGVLAQPKHCIFHIKTILPNVTDVRARPKKKKFPPVSCRLFLAKYGGSMSFR